MAQTENWRGRPQASSPSHNCSSVQMSNVDGPSIAGRTGYVPTALEAAAARYVTQGWPRNDHRASEVRPGTDAYAALVRRHIASLPDADDDSTYSVEVRS